MPSQFELMYRKPKHPRLFESLENANTGLHNLQNYIPLYRRFFSLSETNHNNINLNHRHHVVSFAAGASKNTVSAMIESSADSELPTAAFIKYSPMLDPIKYLSGKYDMSANDLLVLPKYDTENDVVPSSLHQKKMHDPNNSSCVDSFFTYLTSQALHTHGFAHGLDFYGSFLANQDEFTVNAYDDLEYFSTCDFFLKNRNELFRLDEETMGLGQGLGLPNLFDTGRFNATQNPNVTIGEDICMEEAALSLALEDTAACAFNGVFASPSASSAPPQFGLGALEECIIADPDEQDPVFSGSMHGTGGASKSGSRQSNSDDSCSSRSSDDDSDNFANCGNSKQDCDDECDSITDDKGDKGDSSHSGSGSGSSHSGSGSGSSYSDDEEVHYAHIFNFPVHAIVMEKCDNTLDSIMYGKNEMTEPEWCATLMQIIMTLIAYQHMFAFTHNDLHTNNIMFVKTDKKFLHYRCNGVYYRVPTHGRIMKIIDFGRAIYKYRGQTMVSDSFDRAGDAATQYNCEPYLNPKKPRLDPNPSFDLCRLACSLFDYFVEDIRDEAEYAETLKESRVARMVVEWLKDDKGRNVLYKKNGDERYPDFKLYKMIARTVHGAVPHEQLSKPMFAHFAIPRKQIKGKPHIMDIDALPCYAQLN
jgi:hypothetical protein